jgi:predicted MFS family arabinose efflux permease
MPDTQTVRNHRESVVPLRRNHGFSLLLGGSWVSMLGSRVTTIACPLLVLAMSGSPLLAGWACFAAAAPSVLFYLPAGAIIDRCNPRLAMLACEIFRGLIIASMVTALALSELTVWRLIAAAAVEEILEVFSNLAERRLACSVVEPGQVPSALARTEARTHLVVMLGRPLGALLFSVSHILPFSFDSLTFGVSATALLRMRKYQRDDSCAPAPRTRLTREMGDGFRWLRNDPFALIALPLTAGTTFVGQALIMIFLSEARAYNLATPAVGIILAASGVGGVLGSLVAPPLFNRFGCYMFNAQLAGWLLTFACLTEWGWRSFPCIAAAMMFMSFTGAVGNVALDNYIALTAGPGLLGRVMSINSLISFAALALGPLFGAVVLRLHGPHAAVVALLFLVGLLCVAAPILPGWEALCHPSEYVAKVLHHRVAAWSQHRRGRRRAGPAWPG